MVKNVIKGSFSISKVLVFGGNSYVRGKNFSGVIEEKMKILDYFMIASFMVKNVEKTKLLDYFMIANGKECD